MSPQPCCLQCPSTHPHSPCPCWGAQHALLPMLEAFIGYTLQGCHICSLTLLLTKHPEPHPMGQQLRVQAASLFIFNSLISLGAVYRAENPMSQWLLAACGCQVFPYAKQLVQLATLKLALLPTSPPRYLL